MKWAIILGSPDISGGSYVIFEHAIRAKRRGTDVYIITEEKVNMDRLAWHPEARELTWKTYSEVKDEVFDIAVATWWRTVYELHRISAKQYAYFVQSIESRFYTEEEKPLRKLVEATYTLPLHIITEAKWIKNYLREHFNKEAHLVLNGIRKDIYSEEGEKHAKRDPSKLRVLVEGPVDVAFKNVPKTIRLCEKSLADEVWLMTSSPVNKFEGIDRVFSRVPIFETPKVYRSCDVIIKLSYVEGMFGPPLEMFHCGGTSITYDVTGHDEYIINGKNGLVATRDDDEKVVEYINELKINPSKLNELKVQALKTAKEWPSWEESSLEFEQAMMKIIESKQVSQEKLRNYSSFMFDFYVVAEDYKNLCNHEVKGNLFIIKLKQKVSNRFPRFYNKLRMLKLQLKGGFK